MELITKGKKSGIKIKKMIAPAVITLLVILYIAGYLAVCFMIPLPAFIKVLGGILGIAAIAVAAAMFRERIQEIRSGEEDDLSKY